MLIYSCSVVCPCLVDCSFMIALTLKKHKLHCSCVQKRHPILYFCGRDGISYLTWQIAWGWCLPFQPHLVRFWYPPLCLIYELNLVHVDPIIITFSSITNYDMHQLRRALKWQHNYPGNCCRFEISSPLSLIQHVNTSNQTLKTNFMIWL